VLIDRRFHLDAADVLAAADDDLLHAVDDEQEAVLVEIADIPGMEPAVAEGLAVASGLFQ
jgi:hypothetical protein